MGTTYSRNIQIHSRRLWFWNYTRVCVHWSWHARTYAYLRHI